MRILIVEDEIHLCEALAQLLKKNNYTVDTVYNGEDGIDYAMSNIYDVILLDIMLPKVDGISVLKTVRSEGLETPIILLTAKSEIPDKILGLDSGADDYLAKPFNTEELMARIRAVSRRKGAVESSRTISHADIELNTATLTLTCHDKNVTLTLREFELMEYLMKNKGIVLSKEQIIEKLWGFDSEAEANHVEVYISFLRKKLKFIGAKAQISTVRGIGYILKD